MLKRFMCTAAIVLAGISGASAQVVLFSGAGYVTAATGNCAGEGIFQQSFMIGSYLPANLGGNGAQSLLVHVSLPQATKPHAVALTKDGTFATTFERVRGTKITPLELLTFRPRVRVRSKPAVIDANTQKADLAVSVQNANGVAGCDFTLNLNVGRR